jgi:hypothetical protein
MVDRYGYFRAANDSEHMAFADDTLRARLREACNGLCTCGGSGPHDTRTCIAFLIWNEVTR